MPIRTPLSPDPVPMPSRHAFVVVALLVLPVLAFAVGLWLLAESLEQRVEAKVPVTPRERWLAPPPGAVLERIGFGSCLDQRRPQPVWQAVIAARPQLFLMLGDNVYGDARDARLDELRTAYENQAAQPELALARARMPFLATWDDHDYGLNDASAAFPWKAGARQLFAEFWQVRQADLPAEGVYRSRIYGPPGQRVQVILLDTRSFRSAFAELALTERVSTHGRYRPDAAPGSTMLGAAQWAWLEAELRKPADLRLVVTSIQLLAEGHAWERWGHLPAERERFFRLVAETGARGVVLLSGDRHRAGIYRKGAAHPGLAYPLHEITSSALNRTVDRAEPDDAARITPMLGEDNFGLLVVDWAARRLTATLNRAADGAAARKLELAFADLGL